MGWLLSVYIGATVFGVGVTLIDLFGLIGSHEGTADHDAGGHEGDDFHEGGDSHEAGDDHDAGGHEAGDLHGSDHDSAGHETGGHEDDGAQAAAVESHGALAHHETGEPSHHEGSVASHDRPERRSLVLGLLTLLRSAIYFCLGFGPVGWFALATSGSASTTLLWSVPVGAATLFGTRALRRFMRRELNSEIATSEVLMEHGVVTVTIAPGELGKVRIKLGDLYVERYARASSPEAAIRVGASVRVTDVTDDCVYVEEE